MLCVLASSYMFHVDKLPDFLSRTFANVSINVSCAVLLEINKKYTSSRKKIKIKHWPSEEAPYTGARLDTWAHWF